MSLKKPNLGWLCVAFMIFTAFTAGFFLSGTMQSPAVQITRRPPPPTYEVIDCDVISYPININTADASLLTALPGIGDAIAEKIIAYRTENGPFQEINALIHVNGIGEKKLNALLPYITTGGTSNEDIDR